MGYAKDGGNITRVPKQILQKYPDIDISHFTGQVWNAGVTTSPDNFTPFTNKNTLRNSLAKIRGYKCEICGISDWMGKPITLQVHHKNGIHIDNSIDNLQLLCPNCHSQTDTFCNKRKVKTRVTDEEIYKALLENNSITSALQSLGVSASGEHFYRAKAIAQAHDELKNKFRVSNVHRKDETGKDYIAIEEKIVDLSRYK